MARKLSSAFLTTATLEKHCLHRFSGSVQRCWPMPDVAKKHRQGLMCNPRTRMDGTLT